ncbi:hypothetical protein SFRURICE_020843 [Spodoptera frugiperda]|nr:hypothetical protein SFRURICE_020843 [Spodoptera frugiperda]
MEQSKDSSRERAHLRLDDDCHIHTQGRSRRLTKGPNYSHSVSPRPCPLCIRQYCADQTLLSRSASTFRKCLSINIPQNKQKDQSLHTEVPMTCGSDVT